MRTVGVMSGIALQEVGQAGLMELGAEEFMDALKAGLLELEGSKNGVVRYRGERWRVYETDGRLRLLRL